MFAHVTSFRIQAGRGTELRHRIEEELLPWLNQQPGFHGFHLMPVSDTETIAFGMWNSRDAAQAGRAEHDRRIQQAVGGLLTSPPEYKQGEVELHAAAHEPHAHPGM